MQEDQYQYNDDEYIYDQECPDALESNHSNDRPESEDHNYNQQPYEILPLQKIYQELNAILEEIRMLVYLDRGWCLLLLKQFKWDKEILREEYFNKLQHYQKRIGLKPNLLSFDQCKQTVGACYVCCCEDVPIMQNICGHSFCLQCWSCSIQNGVQSGNPFLLCMDVTCGVPLLLEVVERILTFTGDYALMKKWMKRVCELLIMENRNYQFCTGVDCGNCIKINRMDIDTVKCVCGKIFCFRCQSDDHYPCSCQQKTKWTQQVLSEQADAKWISSNAKICPWCKKAVERSMGCNFMACTCGKNFCYMCSQPWQPDHKDHFKCHIYKKRPDEIVNREKQVMQRMNHCTQRYLFNQAVANNYKEIDVFAKRKHLFKVLGLQLTDSEFMETAYKFAIECCQKLKWIYAFTFFNDMKNKRDAFEFSMGEYQKYKENLLKLLAVDLKSFMNQVDNQQKNKTQGKISPKMVEYLQEKFRTLKKQIVNLYTCTKNYKEKFVQELQQITTAIDLQREVEEMKKYTATRSEDKKGKQEKGLLESILSWGKQKSKSKSNKNK